MVIDRGVQKESKVEKFIKDAQSRAPVLKEGEEFHDILYNNIKNEKKTSISLNDQ